MVTSLASLMSPRLVRNGQNLSKRCLVTTPKVAFWPCVPTLPQTHVHPLQHSQTHKEEVKTDFQSMAWAVGLTVQEVLFDQKTVQLSLGQGWILSCHFTEKGTQSGRESTVFYKHFSLLPTFLCSLLCSWLSSIFCPCPRLQHPKRHPD